MVFNGLQEAYERTIATEGGLKNLLLATWELTKAIYLRPVVEAKCLLINPSIVGGLWVCGTMNGGSRSMSLYNVAILLFN